MFWQWLLIIALVTAALFGIYLWIKVMRIIFEKDDLPKDMPKDMLAIEKFKGNKCH